MFILDDLYVSNEVLDFLEASQEPVLDTPAALRWGKQRRLNICDKDQASVLMKQTNARICSLSEMHLEEAKQVCGKDIVRAIETCKDKAACRRILSPLYPEYVFEEYSHRDLLAVDPKTVNYPVVIKPSTGFFSLGIYPVFNAEDWKKALADITENSKSWSDVYNASVVNDALFLVESYIEGEEYAIDAYFDQEGNTVILDILKHDFAGSDDVADRLYYTSKQIIETQLTPVQTFLEKANTLFGFKNFPFHVEVRVDASGNIVPIEFNPLRFAGLCTTDTSYFAYGFKTYECFLENERPVWSKVLAGKDSLVYPMILLGRPGFDPQRPYSFDYEAVKSRFRKVLELRKTKFEQTNSFGFLFTETRTQDWDKELTPILNSNLEEFIRYE